MNGHLLLEGGAEFGGAMEEPDRRAVTLAGGPEVLVCILPTAAAPDNNHNHAGANARRWFEGLGALKVEVLPVIDQASANDFQISSRLREARLIYMLGGFPRYLGQTLDGSAAWDAVLEAYANGAVLAGSSAGAMVMCEFYNDPNEGLVQGLGLVPNACVLPHHNTFGKGWARDLRQTLPQTLLIGIDEQTGMIDDGKTMDAGGARRWQVYGKGSVTLYRPGGAMEKYRRRESFIISWSGKEHSA